MQFLCGVAPGEERFAYHLCQWAVFAIREDDQSWGRRHPSNIYMQALHGLDLVYLWSRTMMIASSGKMECRKHTQFG